MIVWYDFRTESKAASSCVLRKFWWQCSLPVLVSPYLLINISSSMILLFYLIWSNVPGCAGKVDWESSESQQVVVQYEQRSRVDNRMLKNSPRTTGRLVDDWSRDQLGDDTLFSPIWTKYTLFLKDLSKISLKHRLWGKCFATKQIWRSSCQTHVRALSCICNLLGGRRYDIGILKQEACSKEGKLGKRNINNSANFLVTHAIVCHRRRYSHISW